MLWFFLLLVRLRFKKSPPLLGDPYLYRVKITNYSKSSKENIFFLISGIRFTYKFTIPDTKIKQNKIFCCFFEILANVLLTLINWLLKPKCNLKYCFFWHMKNTIWCFRFETLFRMHKNIFFLFFLHCFFCIFGSFCRKPGILIPDLYFLRCKNTARY